MNKLLLAITFFCPLLVFCQVELNRQVIGSLGQTEIIYGNLDISATAGEAVIQTVSKDSLTLTQGFHQPGFKGFLNFRIEIVNTSCPTATDGIATLKELVGCTPPYKIKWSNGSETNIARDLGPGLYSVTVQTPECLLTQTFEVISRPDVNCDLRFFNAFSPNNDFINEGWEIENIESGNYADNTVEIFNRWGQVVWSGERYDNVNVVWKGLSNNGNSLPDATYFYIATVNGIVYKGYIELTR